MPSTKSSKSAYAKPKKDVEQCEERIAKLEERLHELDTILMQPENAADMTLVTEYTDLRRTLDNENDLWLTLSEKLERLNG